MREDQNEQDGAAVADAAVVEPVPEPAGEPAQQAAGEMQQTAQGEGADVAQEIDAEAALASDEMVIVTRGEVRRMFDQFYTELARRGQLGADHENRGAPFLTIGG